MPVEKPTLTDIFRRINVSITAEMIERAKQRDSSHCMIAEGIRLAIPEARNVSVDLATMRFTDRTKGRRYLYLTPSSAQQALINFDQGNEVQPFTMRLQRAAQVLQAGTVRTVDGKLKRPSQKQNGVTKTGRTSKANVPTRLGGTPPPNGALATTRGRIRAFGLRQLNP